MTYVIRRFYRFLLDIVKEFFTLYMKPRKRLLLRAQGSVLFT